MGTQWENIDNNRKEFVHEVYGIDLIQVHPVRNERRSRGTRARKVQLVPTGSCGCDCGLKVIFLSHSVTFFFDSLETIDFFLIAYILGALSVDINDYGSPRGRKLWLGIASYLWSLSTKCRRYYFHISNICGQIYHFFKKVLTRNVFSYIFFLIIT